MQRIAYTVRATCPSAALAAEYIAWLEDGHLDAVIAGGAHSAMIVRLDPAVPVQSHIHVETRYVFATRELFDRYVANSAPALRAEGLRRFPAERGITFDRTVGVIL